MRRKDLPQAIVSTLETAAPSALNAYEIAKTIDPEHPSRNSTLFYQLSKLISNDLVEVVQFEDERAERYLLATAD